MQKFRFPHGPAALGLLVYCLSGSATVAASPETEPSQVTNAPDVYAPPSPAELRVSVDAWLAQRGLLDSPAMETINPSWEFDGKPAPELLFDTLMRTFYLVDAETRQLVDSCRQWSYSPDLLQVQLPGQDRDATEPLLTHNVRYFLARHLTRLNAYNDALEIFEQIDPKHVVDPASCLFHRAVCEHHLLMKPEGLKTLKQLLNETEAVPDRFRKLAELMETDLAAVKEKSLGEVARQMKDVERRLSLQQTDEGVQEVEDRIIATLDELIKQMEDQAQSGGGAGAGAGQGQQSSGPAGDSYGAGTPGMGLTNKREQGKKDHWGNLPPKEKEAAKNMLDQQFPAHYRQAVEEYLKKLAERPAPTP